MEIRQSLIPGREMFAVAVLLLVAMAAVLMSASNDFPALHSILDTAVFMVSGVLAFLLWDLGWRTGQSLPRLEAVCFTVVAVLELLHVITALDFAEAPDAAILLRLGTWSPAAYLLPLGLLVALPLSRRNTNLALFAVALLIVAGGLMVLFALVPRYSPPDFSRHHAAHAVLRSPAVDSGVRRPLATSPRRTASRAYSPSSRRSRSWFRRSSFFRRRRPTRWPSWRTSCASRASSTCCSVSRRWVRSTRRNA